MIHWNGLAATAGYLAGTLVVLIWGTSTPEHRGLVLAQQMASRRLGFVGEFAEVAVEVQQNGGAARALTLRYAISEGSDTQATKSRVWVMRGSRANADNATFEAISHEHGDTYGGQWIRVRGSNAFVPVSDEMRPVAVVGNEICLEDFEPKSVKDFRYEWIGERQLEGRRAVLLTRFPVSSHSRYSRQDVWVDTDHITPLRIDSYDHRGDLLKTARFSDFRTFGHQVRAEQVVIENPRARETTRLRWRQRRFGVQLDDREFLPSGATSAPGMRAAR